MQRLAGALLAAAIASTATLTFAADDAAKTPPLTPTTSGTYVKVQLPNRIRLSKLKPGDIVEGTLARDVYASNHELFPAGRPVQLTVDHLERRRRARNDHWPWVISAFTPRHENFPAFKNATVTQPEGGSTFQVSLISVSQKREVHAQAKKNKPGQPPAGEHGTVEVSKSNAKQPVAPVMVLEAFALDTAVPATEDKPEDAGSEKALPDTRPLADIPTGTQCKILLLGDVSASKSKAGDKVQARLLEPVLLNSRVVLPAGSLIEGKVLKSTPPRWGSRAGSLSMAFTSLTLPGGNLIPITASLAGAELDQRSHTRIDAEGRLHGEHPGKAWMAINLAVSAGVAKEVDDGVQLILEAIVSTATDASTAGTSRIVASCVSGLYMVTRHGRDVMIPRFTEMDISLDRPVSLNQLSQQDSPTMVSEIAGGGK